MGRGLEHGLPMAATITDTQVKEFLRALERIARSLEGIRSDMPVYEPEE